jgi:hypothetical protein
MNRFAMGFLLASLPALASAETYVCVVDQATGFYFNRAQKTWQQTSFKVTQKYLVKPNVDASIAGKWVVVEFGRSAPTAVCEYDFTSTGALRCNGLGGEFVMNRKNLRFLVSYLLGYWTDAIPGEEAGTFVEGENTPLISLGKCSLLER